MAFVTGKQRKNGGRRDVPLSPAAVRLFKRLAHGKSSDARLFLRDDGRLWAHSDWDEPIREAATAAKLPAEPHTGVCAYTLRHCWITDTLRAGTSVLEVARLTGTSVQRGAIAITACIWLGGVMKYSGPCRPALTGTTACCRAGG